MREIVRTNAVARNTRPPSAYFRIPTLPVTSWTGVEISQVSNNSKELPPRRYLRGGISKKYSAALVKGGAIGFADLVQQADRPLQ